MAIQIHFVMYLGSGLISKVCLLHVNGECCTHYSVNYNAEYIISINLFKARASSQQTLNLD